MNKTEVKTVNDLKAFIEERLIGAKVEYNWGLQLLRVLCELDSHYDYRDKNRQSLKITFNPDGECGHDVFICFLKYHAKKESESNGWRSTTTSYFSSFEVSAVNDGEIAIKDIIEGTLKKRAEKADKEKEKGNAFLDKLKEHGFEDEDALVAFIRTNANKEQRYNIGWKVK